MSDPTPSSHDVPSGRWSREAVAIVLAIIFFVVCLLGLLFLLMKEQRVTGYVEVTVRSGDVYHVAQLPVRNVMDVDNARGLVHQAQSMAYAQGPR